jgi:hypothetical protein
MLITEIRFFARQVLAITFFAQGWDYQLDEPIWGELLCVASRRGHAVCFILARCCWQ